MVASIFTKRQRPLSGSTSSRVLRGAKDGDGCSPLPTRSLPRTNKRKVRNKWCFLRVVTGIVMMGPCWLLLVVRQRHPSWELRKTPRGFSATPVPVASFDSSAANEHRVPAKLSEEQSEHANRQQYYADPTPERDVTSKKSVNGARRHVVGTFNGLPVTQGGGGALQSFVRCTPHTSICGNSTWMHRSCAFTNLCFDLNSGQYVVFSSDSDAESNPQQHETDLVTSHFRVQPDHARSLSMALGGINSRWDVGHGFDRGSWKVQWFPEVRHASAFPLDYYQLDDSIVWLPFYSFAGHNVGHLLWDDFYPLWRLATGLGYDEPAHWLLIRHVLQQVLYASCDIRRNKRAQCRSNFDKFLPLLGVSPSTISSSRLVRFRPDSDANAKPPTASLVCAKQGIAGLGMLTDHGNHDHGWQPEGKSWVPHNLGKGRQFYEFAQFALGNIRKAYGIHPPTTQPSIPRISFSVLSSRDWDRRLDFASQVGALRQSLSDEQAQVSTLALWNMTLPEQLQVALSSHIFVSTCGGASMTATFLPRGASLIVFYNPVGGWDFETQTTNGHPARLDWDLLNNAAHLRVHWLPINTMNNAEDLALFVQLVKHELRIISQRRRDATSSS